LAGFCVGAALGAAAWGRDAYFFYGGRFFFKTERWGLAASTFEHFLARRPQDPRACDIHLRLGRIYARRFQRYSEAKRHFETAARDFQGQAACAAAAKDAILDCPDYFPLESGRVWLYGDTASGGRNMKMSVETKAAADGKGWSLDAALYAGGRRVESIHKVYGKKDWAVWELPGQTMVLRYPFRAGQSWRSRRGRDELAFRIEAEGLSVKIRAGTFSDCIKVRESSALFPQSWKYDYYAPGVGRIKTSVGAPGVENPNTELLDYR
jgi:hypothetical protein